MEQISLIPSFESTELHSTDLVAADVVSKLNDEIQAIKTLANPLTCEAKYLPFLAHAFKVDFWDESLDENDKRNLIQSSILLHQRKGTIWAIEKVFESLNMKAVVKEWFEYEGLPYHFKVDLSLEDKEITTQRVQELTKYINIYKNVRSVLDELVLSYLQKHYTTLVASNAGESKSNSLMVTGYENSSRANTMIASCVAFESVCTTVFSLNVAYTPKEKEPIEETITKPGYSETLTGLSQFRLGAMGEVTAIAIQI